MHINKTNYHISDLDRHVFALHELTPLLTAEQAAKTLHTRAINIHRSIARLREKGLFRITPFIDATMLGYENYLLLFSLSSQALDSGILKTIISDSRAAWLGSMAGSYQYGAAIIVKSIRELLTFLEDLSQQYENPFIRMTFVPHFRFELFGRRFLTKMPLHKNSLWFGRQTTDIQTIDELDKKILLDFNSYEFESIRATARRLGEPLATIARRIQRLKTCGVLRGFFIAPPVGFINHIAYRVLLSSKTISSTLRKKVTLVCRQEHSVVFVSETLGAWSYELGIELSSPQELPQFLQRIDACLNPHVLEIQLLSEIEDIKWRFGEFLTQRP